MHVAERFVPLTEAPPAEELVMPDSIALTIFHPPTS